MEKVIILGAGISAFAAYQLLKDQYLITFIVQKGEEVPFPVKKYYQSDFLKRKRLNYLFAVRSPGVPYNDEVLLKLKANHIKIISEVELAYSRLKYKKLVAVTGSNGKTTIVSWLAHILKQQNIKHLVGGNIGIPLSNLVGKSDEETILIVELSSFQLEDISTFRPNIAIIANITPNHLTSVPDFDYYVKSKMNLLNYTNKSDTLIIPKYVYNSFDFFGTYKIKKTKKKKPKYLLGSHNQFNYGIVKATLKQLGVKKYRDDFTGVPFRQEFIGKIKQTKFINDAKSTSVDSTLAALACFKSDSLCLIIGGRNKGLDFTPVLQKKIKTVAVYGELASTFAKSESVHLFKTLEEVIDFLALQLEQYQYVLYSPGCASFDQYKNYLERGKEFNQLINSLINSTDVINNSSDTTIKPKSELGEAK